MKKNEKSVLLSTNIVLLFSRAGHKDTEPVDDVPEVQEGRDIPEHQVHARQGHRRRRHPTRLSALLLGVVTLPAHSWCAIRDIRNIFTSNVNVSSRIGKYS